MDKDLEEMEVEMLADIEKEKEIRKQRWDVVKSAMGPVFGIISCILFLILFVFIIISGQEHNKEEQRKEKIEERQYHEMLFKVWTKQYGNPNDLTIDEFTLSRIEKTNSSFSYKHRWKILPPAKYRSKGKEITDGRK